MRSLTAGARTPPDPVSFGRIYGIDTFRDLAEITLRFDLGFFLKAEIAFVALSLATIAVALYVPNKARLVNVYTVRPFTRDVVVDVNCRNVVGLALLCSVSGALLSSVSWLLYSGADEFGALWHMFALCLVPVGSSIVAYSAVRRCSFRNLLLSGALLSISLLLFLNRTSDDRGADDRR